MNQNPRISVIVPVYNVEQYLPRCVESILAQTYENLEILLVDDGTKDNSGAICDAYARQDARVKAIHKKNGGLSSARNAGIDAATGEYLSFVDSDDWIEPDMYEKMMALMEKYSVRLVCAGRWDVSSETGEKTLGLCPPKEEVISGEALVRRIFHWENIDSAAWDKLYHKSLFASVRYPLGGDLRGRPHHLPHCAGRRTGGHAALPRLQLLSPAGEYHLVLGFGENLPFFQAYGGNLPVCPGQLSGNRGCGAVSAGAFPRLQSADAGFGGQGYPAEICRGIPPVPEGALQAYFLFADQPAVWQAGAGDGSAAGRGGVSSHARALPRGASRENGYKKRGVNYESTKPGCLF